ncbi:MAG: phage tail protein [Leptolyngbyaceae cyanobacterium bins.302]|nr:phage tail protein [Leptolyngbyaceae cyanobacterium bins.302]
MAEPSERPAYPELLTASRFYMELTLDGSSNIDAVFLEGRGFKRNQDVVEICEVTPEQWGTANAKFGRIVRTKIPGNTKTDNIILRRGMTNSARLWKWFADVEAGGWAKQLRDGSLVIYDLESKEQVRFNFKGAWPTRYSIADLSVQSSEMEIEELEIAVESFSRA